MQAEYRNDRWHYSLAVPADMTVSEHEREGGGFTVQFMDATGDKAAATKTMHDSQAVMDRIADKKIVHKNLVSRTKSRLSSAIKALA